MTERVAFMRNEARDGVEEAENKEPETPLSTFIYATLQKKKKKDIKEDHRIMVNTALEYD